MQLDLDLNFILKDIRGNLSSTSAADMVANILAAKTKHFSAAKATRIAIDLVNIDKLPIKIDNVDLDLIYKEIDESADLFNFAKFQILEVIDETKKKESKPEAAKGVEAKAKGKK